MVQKRRRRIRSNNRFNLNSPLLSFVIVLFCIGCWGWTYFYTSDFSLPNNDSNSILNNFFMLFNTKPKAYALGFGLMLGGAFLLHRINYTLILIKEKTWLPFVFYILLISTVPSFLPFKAISIALFCLLISLYQVFFSYHTSYGQPYAFNIGLLLGIGSLFWTPLLWFLPLFWYGMYLFQSLSLRSFLSSIVGSLTIYLMILGWCVWTNNFDFLIQSKINLLAFKLFEPSATSKIEYFDLCAKLVLSIILFFRFFSNQHEDSLRSRRFLSFIIAMTFWIFLFFFIYASFYQDFLYLALLPLSLLLPHFFMSIYKDKKSFLFFIFIILFFSTRFILYIWKF